VNGSRSGEKEGQRLRPLTVGQGSKAAVALVPIAIVVVVQIVVFPMPVGVWVQGVVLGLLGALMAVGLGLVYRLNRVVNFAQGDLGSAPAVLAFGMVGLSGINYFLGLLTGLAAVIVVTAAVEILVIRRFARSPRLMLTVATIGLSQTLIVLSLLIPNIWGETPIGTATVHFPWHLSIGSFAHRLHGRRSGGSHCLGGRAGRGGPVVPVHRPRDRHPGHR